MTPRTSGKPAFSDTRRMRSNILEDLLHQELRSLHSAEKQLLKALTKMARAATLPKLQAAFHARLRETEVQITRLVDVAVLLGKNLGPYKCRGMAQMIQENETLCQEDASDAALMAAAQDLGRYEIEEYGMALTLASRLGLDEVEALLQKNLNEEKAADARLTKLAKSLNQDGAAAGDMPESSARSMRTVHDLDAASRV